MKTKLLLLCTVILLSMSLQAQNTIDIVSPPPTVEGNTKVDITFNYTLDIPGYAFIRFKNGTETANNITAVSMELPAGTGTETLSLDIPRKFEGEVLPLGADYNYQAQLFDHNNGWVGLDTKDYYGVTLVEASNFIDITAYPNPVNAAAMVDITFDYALEIDGHAFIRFREGSSNKTAVNMILSAGSGTETLTLEIPADALGAGSGDGYNYQAQIFDHNNGYSHIVTENYYGIVVEEAVAPANSIVLTTFPTTVAAGSDVNITFDYVTDVVNAHIFIRFKDGSGNLTSVNQIVTAGSGTLTLPLPIPVNDSQDPPQPLPLGSGYSYQAQIFDIDGGTNPYENVISEDIPDDITLEAAPANTVIVTNPPSPVLINSTVDVTVGYTKDIAEALVLVRFRDGAGDEVSQAFNVVTDNSGEIILTLDTPATEAENYSYEVQLYDLESNLLYQKTYRGVAASVSLSTYDLNDNFKNLSIYPNPFKESFSYKFDDNLSDSTSVELYTIDGRKIKSITNKDASYGNAGTVNTSHLSSGMYLVRITSGDLQGTRKLIKK